MQAAVPAVSRQCMRVCVRPKAPQHLRRRPFPPYRFPQRNAPPGVSRSQPALDFLHPRGSPRWMLFLLIVAYQDCTMKEKMESFWPKNLESLALAELKLNSGFWVIGEYLSQIDPILAVSLTQIFSNYSEIRVQF